MSGSDYRYVGTRPVRHDGVGKVTGRDLFGADLRLPGMLHGAVLRSPHAHARILGIDADAALALPGVEAVLTGADFPSLPPDPGPRGWGRVDMRDLTRNLMATDKALYHGHAVAAVAAVSPQLAQEALSLIRVDYEVLPAVLDAGEALEPGAPVLHEDLLTAGIDPPPSQPSNLAQRYQFERGDVEAGFATADVVVEREFRTQAVHQGYIEPHAVVARVDEDGRHLVWCSTQGPFQVRRYCAEILGIELSRIRVTPSEIGGGFGGKTTIYLEPVALMLARMSGRPVKIVMSREEVFRATGPVLGTTIRVRLGARRDGTLTAGQAWLVYEAGAFPGSPVIGGCLTIFASYDIENQWVEGLDVVVNKPKVAQYRAPGAPMAAFAAESVVDELAGLLEIDPIDLRRGNAVSEGSERLYGMPFGLIGMEETLDAARDHPHYQAPLGPNQGRGIAIGYWFNGGMQSTATLSIHEDGSAALVTASPDIGGSRVSLAMMAAETLGIDVDRVQPTIADTDTAGYSDLTGGSRVTFATGLAVIEAAQASIDDMRRRASALWSVDVDDVEWIDGVAEATDGSSRSLTISDIAAKASQTGGPISVTVSLTAQGVGPAFAAHICDVEVDRETGAVVVVRYTAIQDAGRAVHPAYVEGQMQGGAVQGIGWALNEEYIFDSQGRLENADFVDYRMPVASDLPMIDTVIVEVPNPGHPFGVRGVGEVAIIPAIAAVANAIHDAVGVRMLQLPMSPPPVLEALNGPE